MENPIKVDQLFDLEDYNSKMPIQFIKPELHFASSEEEIEFIKTEFAKNVREKYGKEPTIVTQTFTAIVLSALV